MGLALKYFLLLRALELYAEDNGNVNTVCYGGSTVRVFAGE